MKFKYGTRRRALEYEKDWTQRWKKDKTFEKSVAKNSKSENYVFYDGPPFITGSPHYGTLLPSIVKDAVPRYQTMKGRRVERVWGWDCHGLPAENFVEKQLGITDRRDIGTKISLEKYITTARESMVQTGDSWESTIDRIGRWVDFKGGYKTMDKNFMESVWWAFKQLYEKGKIYEGEKVLMYDTKFASPLSKSEVTMDNDAYQTVTDPSVFVKFKIKDEQKYLLAWTTTPWTLSANMALAVNPAMKYVEVGVGDETLILAKDLVEKVLTDEKHQPLEYRIVREMSGKNLIDMQYVPILTDEESSVISEKAHKVYTADFVEDEGGTGVVHIAPAYGPDDYDLAKKHKIPVKHVIDDNGFYFDDTAKELAKLGVLPTDGDKIEVWSANKFIAKQLQEAGVVWKIEYIRHEYPFNPRSGQRIMYRAIPSWFFDVEDNKSLMLEQNKNINWYPEHFKEGRFKKNIEQAPDWNISRNRFWATAMPVWKGDKGSIKVVGSYAELKELSGVELDDYHRPWVDDITFEIDGEKFTRIEEVLDCWFESGSMPFAQFHYPFENKEKFEKGFPGDFIVEYVGQIRAWFYYLHVVNTALFGRNPFKNAIVTGTIAGNDGRKMSKSLGNFTDPNILMDEYSADSLRFLLLSSPLLSGEDFALKDKDVSDVARKLTMIWNMYDFFTMYAEVDGWEFDPNDQSQNPEKPIKQSVAYYVENDKGEFTAVKRLETDESLPGVWGLPAASLADGESFEEAAKRAALGKLNIRVKEMLFDGEDKIDRDEYILHLKEYKITNYDGKPVLQKDQNGDDYYAELAWQSNPEILHEAAEKGSLCSRIFLRNRGKWANENPMLTLSPNNVKSPLDKWIISRIHELCEHVTKYMDEYNIPDAMNAILPFVDDASNWYVRRSRRRFWKSEDDGDKNDAYKTLHYILSRLAQILAPFTPFLAEELWAKMVGDGSVHLLDWPTVGEIDEKVLTDMTRAREIITEGLALRMEREDGFGQIKIRQPLAELTYGGEKLDEFYEQIIAEEVNVKQILYKKSVQEQGQNHVELNKHLTPELKQEGFVRELIRAIQNARKKAGLNVDDRIKLSVSIEVPKEYIDLVKAETLAVEFNHDQKYKYNENIKVDDQDIVLSLENNDK